MSDFEDLLREGEEVPVEGWDFSWFEGRATEERPSWGYSTLLAEHMARAGAALDVQTGGAEVLAGIPKAPALLRATESWPPNLEIARRNLAPLNGEVVHVEDTDDLPFADGTFDLVVSRHPTTVLWDEIARVLKPGGRMGVTDIVGEDRLTSEERLARGSFTGCIAGALSFTEFREGLESVGLVDVSLTATHDVADGMVSAIVRATKPADAAPLIDLAARTDLAFPVAESGCCGGGGCC